MFGQKNYAAAAKAYQSYLTAEPEVKNRGQAYYWLGRSLQSLGEPVEAIRAFDAASTAGSRFSGVALLEAIDMVSAQGDGARVHELVARGERSFASDNEVLPDVLYRKGRLLADNGNPVEARRQWEDVIRRSPGHRAADQSRLSLVRLSLSQGDAVQARSLAQQVATSRADELGAEAQFLVGEAWSAAGDWKQAATAYLRVRYVFTSYRDWIHRALLELGRTYDRSGDKARAQEPYRDLLNRKPEESIRREAERRLGALGS